MSAQRRLHVQLPGGEGHAVLQQPVLLLIGRPESHGEHFLNADVDVPGPADFYVCIGNVGMRHHLFCDLVRIQPEDTPAVDIGGGKELLL